MTNDSPMQRAMKLAAVSGLKAALGPALISASQNRPERQALAMAAVGEMMIDKLPFMPSRSRLPLLLPRVFSGYWTAKQSLERDGVNDPTSAAMGAAVAAGVAIAAPLVRKTLSTLLGMPDSVVALGEDYLALKVGGEAVGLSMDDLKAIGTEAFGGIRGQVTPAFDVIKERLLPSHS